jgi:hypothetical protein
MLNPDFIRRAALSGKVFLFSYAALKNNECFYLYCSATVIFDPGASFAVVERPRRSRALVSGSEWTGLNHSH